MTTPIINELTLKALQDAEQLDTDNNIAVAAGTALSILREVQVSTGI